MGQAANSGRNATLDNKKRRAAGRGENVSKGERNSALKDSMRPRKGAAPAGGASGPRTSADSIYGDKPGQIGSARRGSKTKRGAARASRAAGSARGR